MKNTTEKTIVRKEAVVTISDRETSIVQMIADEKSREEIAECLNLSIRTVESDLYRLLAKTGCKTPEGAIALFLRNKLIK